MSEIIKKFIGSTVSFHEATPKDIKEIASWLHEQIHDMNVDEEFIAYEQNRPRFLPALRGLRDFIKNNETAKDIELIKQLQNINKHLQERMDIVLHTGPSTKIALEAFDRVVKYEEQLKILNVSWMKLHTTICAIGLAAGMSQKDVDVIAESMACSMGDGMEVLQFLKDNQMIDV